MKTRLDQETKEKESAKQKYTNAKLSEILSRETADAIIGHDVVSQNWILQGKVRLNDDDKPVFIDGDNEIDIKTGIENFKKSRPDLVKNKQSAGTGGTSGKNVSAKTMNEKEWLTLEPKARANFINSGGNLTQ
jgi:hypothetical protein